MHNEDELQARWRRWLGYAIMTLVLGAVALAITAWGINRQMSLHCRSKSNPSVYGQEFCTIPGTKPSAKSRG